ncbi:MAG TPA: RagB/SusD family nutrient uptake outer membrane protein [Longimicrobiales bacterium]|nr:RagB/SusD family nutrient uptake outer membrane protein [Longimicrobiales bacterium]
MKGVLVLGLAASLTACLDLSVLNENLPDRRRALSNETDVENILAISTWRRWYAVNHSLANIAGTFPLLADEAGNTSSYMNTHWGQEPPIAFRNDDLSPHIWMPRTGYTEFSECVANANDGLQQINEGMRLVTLDIGADSARDNTDRAWAWGKLWQGICAAYLANYLDRFAMATEEIKLPEGWEALAAWETERLREPNWQPNLQIGIEAIEAAIKRMETGAQWMTPEQWINGQRYSNQQMIEFAHTMIARMLIYSARYPADREALDWNKILQHTERGLTYDWGPILASGVITDPSYLARLNNTGSGSFRIDYRTIGPADQSGRWQTWMKTEPRQDADRFLIVTPDRRITGNTPTSNGAYLRYLTAFSGYNTNLGLNHRSFYSWWRRINYQGANHTAGHFALATEDENRLYRAEAMLRLGRLQEAAELINVTRTRGQKAGNTTWATNLPPVTAAGGVPTVNGACVPRRADGTCGDLMDALMYERDIELIGIESTRSWMDRRGFGQLRDGVFVHLPVPARWLVSFGLPLYTFGGIGGEGSATCTARLSCLLP